VIRVMPYGRRPTCECGECDKCLHRAFVRRDRIRDQIGWQPKDRRVERWMSTFASVYWSEVYRRGVRVWRIKPYRN